MSNNKYKYIGAAHWGNPNRVSFLAPIFEMDDSHYIQNVTNDYRVEGFKKVLVANMNLLIDTTKDISVEIGEEALFCFNVRGQYQIEGTRNQITQELTRLLFQDNTLNVHSRFLIANFLSLYKTQIELLLEVNKDLEEKGVESIDEEIIFEKETVDQDKFDFNSVLSYYSSLKKATDNIAEHDMIFLDEEYIYFSNYRYSYEAIFDSSSIKNELFGEFFIRSLTECEKMKSGKDDNSISQKAKSYMLSSPHFFMSNAELNEALCKTAGWIDPNIDIVKIGLTQEKQFNKELGKNKLSKKDKREVLELTSDIINNSNSKLGVTLENRFTIKPSNKERFFKIQRDPA
jgi:hypothetical protein